jgi:ABC-type multidrug transport system ATPase subunit
MRGGRILAADTPENLQKSIGSQLVTEIAAPLEELKAAWEAMPGAGDCVITAVDGDYLRCSAVVPDGQDLRAEIFALVKERGWKLRELSRTRHSLEDIYIRLTRLESEEEVF